jgi:hypothetical protein
MMDTAKAQITVAKSGAPQVKPDPIEVYKTEDSKAGRHKKIEWTISGADGDIFLVVIEDGGPFDEDSNNPKKGAYLVTVRGGTAELKTKKLKTDTPVRDWKYTIVRVSGTDVKYDDPRISVRG